MYVEYKVRPVTRYIVTVFESRELPDGTGMGSSGELATFNHVSEANDVARAMAEDARRKYVTGITDCQNKVVFTPFGNRQADLA